MPRSPGRKLREVLATGRLQRNEMRCVDPWRATRALTSEPEIFRILGLDYVPPHMRVMD